MVAESIQVAVALALHTASDSYIGERLPTEVLELAKREGLISDAGSGPYVTEAGRDRMERIMEALRG